MDEFLYASIINAGKNVVTCAQRWNGRYFYEVLNPGGCGYYLTSDKYYTVEEVYNEHYDELEHD